MAKSKKSKILASMLAVSTMAVFYAAPVMAAEFTLDSNSSVTTGTTTSGGYEQNEVHVNIDDGVNGSQTIGTFYSNEMEAGFKTDYTMTASTFTLEAGGRTWASLTVNGLTYTNQNTLNNVSLTADGLTFSNLNNPEDAAVLNAAAINSWNEKTQNINAKETVAGKTYFDGKVIADKFGTSNDAFYVDENGTIKGNSLIIGKNGDNAVFKVDRNGNSEIKGNVTMAKDATVDGVDVSELGGNVAGISRNNGDLPYGQGVTSIEGSTSFDANGMNVGNGAVVANTDGSFRAANGAFDVDTNGNVTANRVTVGNTVVTGTSVTTDVIYANEGQIGGTLIKGGFVNADNVFSANYNLEEVGDNLADLTGSVGNIGDNVAGITRDAEDGALPGEGTTTIEDTLSVSGDSVLAQVGSSQLVITEDVAGLSSGNASFALSNNELQLSVAGNGLLVNQFGTNLNGTVNFIGHDGNSYTLSDLEGRVYDLEQKTQNITSTDPGQGGSSEVPPTGDGNTGFEGNVTVGGNINADEGNFNKVNTDEINVGDNTFIDGDSVNSNEGNFKDKVTVGSGENQTVINNGGITVGDSEGTSINHDEVRVGGEDGSYMNENDVVTGEGNSLNDTANRVGNLEQGVSELNNRVGELEDRIDKVGAMAAAIANLRTMGYDPAAPTEVAVGIGQYRDETGAALGLFHYPNRDFMLSLSVSTSGDEVMGGIGATWKFGRKSPEKVAEIKKAQAEADARRAEEAKLAKAEEMKQAAKEAKIKAQQERHAKLAAERAAQAEAAK